MSKLQNFNGHFANLNMNMPLSPPWKERDGSICGETKSTGRPGRMYCIPMIWRGF